MRLERISISNFKGLLNEFFEPTNFGCLVGENNAGKSSVLQAIVYGLNRPPQLPITLFYDPTQPVEFVLNFSGVTEEHLQRLVEEHRIKMAEIIVEEQLTLSVRYRPNEKVETNVLKYIPREPRYLLDSISAVLAGKRGAAIRDAIAEHYPEFSENLPDTLNITSAKTHLSDRIAQLPRTEFEQTYGPLPSGIPSSITALLPEPIYIPAVKNLSDDLKTTQSTSFGRLLGLLLEDVSPDLEQINNSLATLNQFFNRVIENGHEVDRRHTKVQAIESLVESLLSRNFPRVKVELKIPPPELKTILNAAQIFIDDGSRDLIDNKGDGIKRSLMFALLQAYVIHLSNQRIAANQNEAIQRPLLFLFEEPELYLHPKSQRILFNTLAKISEDHQVVVTTHSPIFFAPGVTAEFVRVAKCEADPKPVGKLFPVNFSLDHVRAETFRLARFENADAAFFSQRVVLFEGESDDAYCKHIAQLLNPDWDFDQSNVALVKVSGKGNFAKFRGFFNAFGIEVKVVADLDALFDGYQHLGATQAISQLRTHALLQIDSRITQLGIVAEPASRQIRNKVNQDSWRTKYQSAKNALRAIQASRTVDDNTLDLLDQLFTWEQDIARVRVCCEDIQAANALIPVLDALRLEGICVLSRGAIEDYYPNGTTTGLPKPERALAAASLVNTQQQATTLSHPLQGGRMTELEEIFEEIFRDL